MKHRVHTIASPRQQRFVTQVALEVPGFLRVWPRERGPSRQRPHLAATRQQAPGQRLTNETGSTGDEHDAVGFKHVHRSRQPWVL